MDIDNETGLPVLPEDYFWRVRYEDDNDHNPYPAIVVSMRQKTKFLWWETSRHITSQGVNWFSKDVVYSGQNRYQAYAVSPASKELVKKKILDLASTLYDKRKATFDDQRRRDAFKAAASELAGDYPPRSLND